MQHDDGQNPQNVDQADIVLVGVSRTSKTPTSIYLANRGVKTANIPIVLDVPLPDGLATAKRPLVVGLVASAERISQVRQNRILTHQPEGQERFSESTMRPLNEMATHSLSGRTHEQLSTAAADFDTYVDRASIVRELTYARQLCSRHGWPVIDVTRRSIEETAAAILALRGKP